MEERGFTIDERDFLLRDVEVVVPGYDKKYTGYFHEFNKNQNGNLVAIVEKEDGSIEAPHIEDVKFINEIIGADNSDLKASSEAPKLNEEESNANTTDNTADNTGAEKTEVAEQVINVAEGAENKVE